MPLYFARFAQFPHFFKVLTVFFSLATLISLTGAPSLPGARCAIAVIYYSNLVDKFGSNPSLCSFVRLLDLRRRKLWILGGNAPTQTAEDNNKGVICEGIRIAAGCTTPFEVVAEVRRKPVAEAFLFKFSIDHIMRRTADQCPADIVLAPSRCPLTDLENADVVIILAEASTKLQHSVILVS
ncbi:hypothetical protein RB195_018625 [Necator americanus]|uniref:MD-2-related lipid-recognition domain-containing protein n=1 Tax=Necator americanus TaxID=51031 RepID=A0ABR1CCR9_NECAM